MILAFEELESLTISLSICTVQPIQYFPAMLRIQNDSEGGHLTNQNLQREGMGDSGLSFIGKVMVKGDIRGGV